MNIFTMEILKQLSNFGLNVLRIYVGNLMTSLNGNGFHVSLLNIPPTNILANLDAPTLAPAWPKNFSAQDLGLKFVITF